MNTNWLLERLREPSTYRGLVWLLTACGVSLRPELLEYITAAGMAAAGLLGVLLAEEPRRVDVHLPSIDLNRAAPADPAATDRAP